MVYVLQFNLTRYQRQAGLTAVMKTLLARTDSDSPVLSQDCQAAMVLALK